MGRQSTTASIGWKNFGALDRVAGHRVIGVIGESPSTELLLIRLWGTQRLREAEQILGNDADSTAARAVDIGDEKE